MKIPLFALLSAVLLLPGCSRLVSIAVQAETERLAKLRDWEAGLTKMDCTQLDDEYADMVKAKGDMVDFDQRQDILRDEMTGKSCTLPEGLA